MLKWMFNIWCVAVADVNREHTSAPLIGIYPTVPHEYYLEMYQHWVERFGARTVVLPARGDADSWIPKLSAVLIPGGPGGKGDVKPFVRALVERAIQVNKDGDFFPVWGTCLGFEWLIEVIGGNRAIQTNFEADDLSQKLNFTLASPGRLFAGANASIMTWLATEDITYNMHDLGIEPGHFKRDRALSKNMEVLATSVDRTGKPFVAAVEHQKFPLYGVQFHPEKVRYAKNPHFMNWTMHIPKTPEAIAASDYLARFFVAQASKTKRMYEAPILV